ncbi:hypothetical protein GCM10023148_51240 [Actinokineospora soli]
MRKAAVPLIALALVTGACSSPETGEPVPSGDRGTQSQQPPTTTTTATAELPARPQALPLDQVNPCDLLTEAQRADLDVVRARETKDDSEAECAFTVETPERNLDLRVVADTREGVDAWLNTPRNVTVEPTTIDGFGAAHFWFKGGSGADCNTAVDVADGQHLQVELLLPGAGWTQEKLCETTDRFAAAALTTLRAG